jgi:hypothetical protein
MDITKVAALRRRLQADKESQEKTAGLWDGVRSVFNPDNVGRQLGGAGISLIGSAAATAGAAAGVKAFGALRDKFEKSHHLKQMLEGNPDLQKFDRQQVQKGFNAIFALNPTYAKEPTIAGSILRDNFAAGSPSGIQPHFHGELLKTLRNNEVGELEKSFIHGATKAPFLPGRDLEERAYNEGLQQQLDERRHGHQMAVQEAKSKAMVASEQVKAKESEVASKAQQQHGYNLEHYKEQLRRSSGNLPSPPVIP